MNCPKCKNLIPDNSLYCPVCGEPLTMPDTTATNGLPPVIAALHNTVSSKLFFVAAILFTVAAAAQLVLGLGLPVFEVLIAIAMWLMVSANKKGNIMGYATPLKMISGTALANTIVMWVTGGFFALCGALSIVIDPSWDGLFDAFSGVEGFTGEEFAIFEESSIISIVLGVALIIAAVVVFVLNIFVYMKAHKFAKSVSLTFSTGINQITNLGYVKNMMLVFGIVVGVSAAGSMMDVSALISNGSVAAAYILLYILLGNLEKEISLRVY